MKQELKNNPNDGTENKGNPTSRSGKTAWMQGKFVTSFNAIFDFSSRLIKLVIFLVIIVLILWKLPFIDWRGTSSKLIANNTPIQIQSPQSSSVKDTTTKNTALPTQVSKPTVSQHHPSSKPPKASEQTVNADFLAVYQFGQLVFTVDKPYAISGDLLTFDKLLLKGKPDYDKPFLYGGVEIRITRINEYIGLLV